MSKYVDEIFYIVRRDFSPETKEEEVSSIIRKAQLDVIKRIDQKYEENELTDDDYSYAHAVHEVEKEINQLKQEEQGDE